MDPQRAVKLGVNPSEVKIESYAYRYGGHWIAFVPDPERDKVILTSSKDIFAVCQWFALLKRSYNEAQAHGS